MRAVGQTLSTLGGALGTAAHLAATLRPWGRLESNPKTTGRFLRHSTGPRNHPVASAEVPHGIFVKYWPQDSNTESRLVIPRSSLTR